MGVEPLSRGGITSECRDKKQNSPEGLLDYLDTSDTEVSEISITISPHEGGAYCLGE